MTIPPNLYHYTSQKGLKGILQNKNLWMTNIRYLNDSSEFSYTINLVKTELKKRKDKYYNHCKTLYDKTYKAYELTEKFCNNLLNNTEYEFYVFSLSQKKNDLNQWREYCPKEGGFCVEFDYKKLSHIINPDGGNQENHINIKKCEYHKKEQIKSISSLFDNLDTSFTSTNSVDLPHIFIKFVLDILKLSSYCKDTSFKDEIEYRIISRGEHNNKIYREGKSTIIPYIEFSPLDDDNKLPISKIWIGPTPHPELSKMSVESLLKSEKYKGVKVIKSKIPYRSW